MKNQENESGGAKVIDLAIERLKRRGPEPESEDIGFEEPSEAASIEEAVTESIEIRPDQDVIVDLASRILEVLDDSADLHPIKTLAAMQLAMSTICQCYEKKYGRGTARKIYEAAMRTSRKYRPVYTEGNDE